MLRLTFEQARAVLEPSLQDTHDWSDVEAAVAAGEAHFWPGERSAAVCEFVHYPKYTVYHVWLCGGELPELIEMEKSIAAFAKATGCRRVTAATRPGWERALTGYKRLCVVLAKEV